jgi:hypothetical protein
MFKVTFVKYIFDSDHDDAKARFAVLSREEVLPFVPQVGIEIMWPLEKTQEIVECAWRTEHDDFRCRVEDFYAVNFSLDAPDFDEYLDDSPERGWAVSSIYPAQ